MLVSVLRRCAIAAGLGSLVRRALLRRRRRLRRGGLITRGWRLALGLLLLRGSGRKRARRGKGARGRRRRQRRQVRRRLAPQQPRELLGRNRVLLTRHVIVSLARLEGGLRLIAQDRRLDEDHQIIARRGVVARLEQEADERDAAEERHAVVAAVLLVRNQAAEYDDTAV